MINKYAKIVSGVVADVILATAPFGDYSVLVPDGVGVEFTANADGSFTAPAIELATPTETEYKLAVKSYLDAKAQELGFFSILDASSYADDSTVPEYQNHGVALRAWRSTVWQAAFVILSNIESNMRPAPSIADFVNELPTYGA